MEIPLNGSFHTWEGRGLLRGKGYFTRFIAFHRGLDCTQSECVPTALPHADVGQKARSGQCSVDREISMGRKRLTTAEDLASQDVASKPPSHVTSP